MSETTNDSSIVGETLPTDKEQLPDVILSAVARSGQGFQSWFYVVRDVLRELKTITSAEIPPVIFALVKAGKIESRPHPDGFELRLPVPVVMPPTAPGTAPAAETTQGQTAIQRRDLWNTIRGKFGGSLDDLEEILCMMEDISGRAITREHPGLLMREIERRMRAKA